MVNQISTKDKHLFTRFSMFPKGYRAYNDDWLLTDNGDMMNSLSNYEIANYDLDREDLLLHLSYKRWFDANTFIPAWFEACSRKGMSVVQLRVRY